MSRAVMQQALEALEWAWGGEPLTGKEMVAIAALRAALAEPRPIQECYGDCPTDPAICPNPCNFEGRPKPEQPVAWQCREHGDTEWVDCGNDAYGVNPRRYAYRALYTAPTPRRPLTDEEIERACVPLGAAMLSFTEVARAIEKAHGIGEQT